MACLMTGNFIMDYPLSFAGQLKQHLRSLRKSRALKQADLARQLGVVQSRIAALEKNPNVMTVDTLFKLLKALDVQLVLRDERPEAEGERSLKQTQSPKNGSPKSGKSEGEW